MHSITISQLILGAAWLFCAYGLYWVIKDFGRERKRMMDKFETFIKSLVSARTAAFGYNHNDMEDAWQESAKQSAAEIAHLKTVIENLEMSVASFIKGRSAWHDIIKECEQTLGCPDTAESPLMCNLPNLIRDLKQAHADHRLMDQHTRESYEEKGALVERERVCAIIMRHKGLFDLEKAELIESIEKG